MNLRKVALILLTLPASVMAQCNGTWSGATNSNWSNSGNWSPCVPTIAGDTALFPNLSLATDTVNVDTSKVITNLTLNAPNTQYTFTNTGIRTLSFQSFNTTLPTFDVTNGSHTFRNIINLLSDTTLTVNSQATFDINSTVGSLTGVTLTVTGSGTILNKEEHSGIVYFGFSPQNLVIQPGITLSNEGAFGLVGFGTNQIVMNGGTVSSEGLIGVSCNEIIINGGVFNNFNEGILALSGSGPMQFTINDGLITNNDSFIGQTLVTAGVPMVITMNGGTVINENISEFAEESLFTMHGGLFNNDPTSFVGPTTLTIDGGTFINDGEVIGNVFASGSALITGSGHFSNSGTPFTLQNGATVIPTGTLTLDPQGTYLQTSEGTLVTDVTSASSFGQISSYKASLNGTLDINAETGFNVNPGVNLPIVITTNGVSGKFSTVDFHLPPLTVPVLTYLPDSVLLSFSPVLDKAIDYFYLPILSAVNQINTKIDLLLEQMRFRCCCPGVLLYAEATGSFGGVHSKHDVIGFDYNTAGALVGIDYADCWGGIGLMVDYEKINGKPYKRFSSIDMHHIHGSLYGTFFATEALAINGIVGGGHDYTTLNRTTGYREDLSAQGKPNVNFYDAYLGIEYAINPCISPVIWTPLIGVQYIRIDINKYQEKETHGFALRVERHQVDSLRPFLGLKASCPLEKNGIALVPEINFIWQRECLNNRRFAHFSSVVPGTPFSIPIDAPHRNIYLAGFNLLVDLCNGFGAEITYEFEGSRSMFDHFFYAGANVAF